MIDVPALWGGHRGRATRLRGSSGYGQRPGAKAPGSAADRAAGAHTAAGSNPFSTAKSAAAPRVETPIFV